MTMMLMMMMMVLRIAKSNTFPVELGGTAKWLSTVDILLLLYLNWSFLLLCI